MKREKNGVERVSIKKKIKFVVFFFFSQRRFGREQGMWYYRYWTNP